MEQTISRVLLAGTGSGCGKTTVTCAVLQALTDRGLRVGAFKCGPDYIDPMFHRSVLGVESHNLDLFLAGEDDVRRLYAKYSGGHGAAVTEGAMGFYDGLGGTTDRASAWHVSDTLGLPVLLALRPKGASLTLAAQVGGLQSFRRESHIAGLFLNDCSTMLAKSLVPMLERETGLPVLGWLPHMEEAVLESRHLGLYTAGEIENLSARIDRAADVLSENLDWDQLDALFSRRADRAAVPAAERVDGVPVAVARDEAFCFAYAETLDALREAGASLRFFSPLGDAALPGDACALYLPGGYPELHAAGLAENADMRRAVRDAVAGGMPTVAECGGFLYLGQTLEDGGGRAYPMAGVLPGEAVRRERLVRFGYAELSAAGASMLFRPGEAAPVHEFHYWDSTENGDGLVARKPLTGRSWQCGFVNEHLYAAFPHLYFAGRPALARRFVRAAEHWRDAHE